jgi:A/G-specific adenine glycosylase
VVAFAVEPASPPTDASAAAPDAVAPADGAPDAVAPAARDAILAWYADHGRPLAFRRTTDPYAILVSEAMAQQTQAARAAAYWERFTERYPTVHDLADASPADVLRAWAGLGYDRRALALWRAARMIVDEFAGRVPDTVEDLERLPGVGPYTARAVAALAYGRPVGAVDVNVRRVLTRMVIGEPERIAAPRRSEASVAQDIADASVPLDHPGAWTHALMDVGATVCKPRDPRCEACPAQPWCRYALGIEAATTLAVTTPPTPPTPRPSPVAFPATNRWLRGRILDRLRAGQDGAWIGFESVIGVHDVELVHRAVRAMARDGVLELETRTDDRIRARLPLG